MPTVTFGRRAHVAPGGEPPVLPPRRKPPFMYRAPTQRRNAPAIKGVARRWPPVLFDPPPPEAISGMSLYRDYDWTGATPLAAWYLQDGNPPSNNEKSVPKPSNVTVITDASCSGGKYLQLAVRVESYVGYAYTGVQMENFYDGPAPGRGLPTNIHTGYGQGNPFYYESRLRYDGYSGMWVGPWAYDLDSGNGEEVDLMETINTREPKSTLHSIDHVFDVGTQSYAGSNDGNWHRYGIRFDGIAIKWFFDNVKVLQLNDATKSAGFVNANMGLKLQAFCGGNFPDDDAGLPHGSTPVGGTTFPRFFDCDWLRIYR